MSWDVTQQRFLALAAEDLLRGLLLLFVVVRVANQSVAHSVEHIDDVAEGLVDLTHGVVRGGLGLTAPARAGDVHRRRPHLAGLVLNGLGVDLEAARHRPHFVRVGHKTSCHVGFLLAAWLLDDVVKTVAGSFTRYATAEPNEKR